jgi:hypothetical protein
MTLDQLAMGARAAAGHLPGRGNRRIAYLGTIAVPVTLRLGATTAPNVAGA